MEALPKQWLQIASQQSETCYILISRLYFDCKFAICCVRSF